MSSEISLIYEFAVQSCQGYLPCSFLADVLHPTCSSSMCQYQKLLHAVQSIPRHHTDLLTAANSPGINYDRNRIKYQNTTMIEMEKKVKL